MRHLLIASIIALLAAGCSSTYITSSWKDPEQQVKKYNKVVVLALVSDPSPSVREKMEQHIAGDLGEYGYIAVCSCEEYNPVAFKDLPEDQALSRLKSSGVDAVLTVVLLDKKKEAHYISNEAYPGTGRVDNSPFLNYYRDKYASTKASGYYVTNTRYFWESKFYDLETGKAVYSAQSSSFEPKDTETMGHEYGKMIVKDMLAKGVIGDYKAVLKPM
jgi:hypothetical protein